MSPGAGPIAGPVAGPVDGPVAGPIAGSVAGPVAGLVAGPVAGLVAGIVPGDPREAADLRTTLAWLASTEDVYRRVRPMTPDPHLVSYVVPVDPSTGRVLLGEHVLSGLWLPPGGHVEVGEHPAATARREAREELGVDAAVGAPLFLSVTRTVGSGSHTDVSLWFPFPLRSDATVRPDPREFRGCRWWQPGETPGSPDPAYGRFVAKLSRWAGGFRGPRS